MKNSLPLKDRLNMRSKRVGECIEWTGYINKFGYGRLTYKNKQEAAHRASWETNVGAIPNGMFVCHKCDNRRCINPEHLFIGTQKDNMQDMKLKARRRGVGGAHGINHPKAKLNDSAVYEIRTKALSLIEIINKFNISRAHVYRILNKTNWKHI